MNVEEMLKKGMQQNAKSFWITEAWVPEVKQRFKRKDA
jgi:hypothetical protein